MADHVNVSRDVAPPTGSAANNPRQSYYRDLGNGAFAEVFAANAYVRQGGVWVPWDGSVTFGTGTQVEVIDASGHVFTLDSSGRPTVLIAAGQSVAATQSGNWNVGTKSASVNVGQDAMTSGAKKQLNGGTSIPSTNGVIIQALSGNAASVFVGGSAVTTGTGFELQAGQALALSCSDINAVYIIGTGSDGVCWNVV